MVYEKEYKGEFIVPVFTYESGYWEQVMKPRLQDQGWYIAEVDCANVEDIEDCGTRLLRELNFKVPEHGYINAMGSKIISLISTALICAKVSLCFIRILKISSLPIRICIRGMGLSSCFS